MLIYTITMRYLIVGKDEEMTSPFPESLMPFVSEHHFIRNEWIIKEGEYPEAIYFLIEGKAKIYVTHSNGKVSLLDFIAPNTYIGEMELLNDSYYSKGIQALTATTCLALPLKPYREALLSDVLFLRNLATLLSNKATLMSKKYSQGLAYPVENRLAHFILQTADNFIYQEKHSVVCDYLGVSYRHLLYVMAQFCEKGYLLKEQNYYQIGDNDALKKLAQEVM